MQEVNRCGLYIKQTEVRFERTLSSIKDSKGRFLDIGCGPAPISEKLLREDDRTIYGIDLSFDDLRSAKNKGIEVIIANLSDGIPLKKSSIDVVLATEVLEHIYNTDFLLDEIRRVLKIRGLLVLSVPNICSLTSRARCLIGDLPSGVEYATETIEGRKRAGHVRAFNKRVLLALLKKHRFEVEDIRTDVIIIPKLLKVPWRFKFLIGYGETIIVKARAMT